MLIKVALTRDRPQTRVAITDDVFATMLIQLAFPLDRPNTHKSCDHRRHICYNANQSTSHYWTDHTQQSRSQMTDIPAKMLITVAFTLDRPQTPVAITDDVFATVLIKVAFTLDRSYTHNSRDHRRDSCYSAHQTTLD